MLTALPIIIFVVLLATGVPIAFVLALTGIAHMVSFGYTDIANIISQKMFYGIDVFSYTCIPFFICAGQIMNKGGVTQRIVDVAQEFIGHKRGGLAYAVVLVGMVLAGVSVKRMFVAGIVPGVFLGLCFMAVVFLRAKRRNYPKYREKFAPKEAFKALIHGLPSLMVPVIIVGGVLGGVFTPTESGAIACAAATILGFCYKNLRLRDFPKILAESGMVSAGILLIIACGNILAWSLAYDAVPERLVNGILSITTNGNLVMLLVLLLLFVVGCVMEAFAAELILVPVLKPLGDAMGFDPIHFGIIVIIMLTLALMTPPVGMLLFTTSKVARIDLNKLNRSIWRFVAAGMIGTVILAYIPQITIWLPNLLYPAG